jgi:hypothetical protein
MAKGTLIIIFIALISACKPMQTFQRSGQFHKHGNEYVFKAYEDWHLFDTTKAEPDTVYEFMYARKKPN